jgi:hypothetical protein
VVDVRGKRRRLNAEALRRREGQGKGRSGYRHACASLRLWQSPFSWDVMDVRGKRRRLNAEALRRREGQGKGRSGYRHACASLRLCRSPFSWDVVDVMDVRGNEEDSTQRRGDAERVKGKEKAGTGTCALRCACASPRFLRHVCARRLAPLVPVPVFLRSVALQEEWGRRGLNFRAGHGGCFFCGSQTPSVQ